MRKSMAVVVGLAFLLFAAFAMAQTSGQYGSQSSTTTTNTQTQTTTSSASGSPQTVEGCLVKEQSDFFLIPRSGNPIRLQAGGQDLSEHQGHKVKITGNETPTGASSGMGSSMGSMPSSGAGASAGTSGAATGTPDTSGQSGTSSSGAVGSSTNPPASSSSTAASGTGSDLHKLSDQDMTVSNIQHVAASCPVNWNPKVPVPSSTPGSSSQRY